ncbi:MAG TPA: CHAD domain-containing protein [Thermoanaerobaculia bacterium]
MAYRIDLTLPLPQEIRRILGEELGGAAAELRGRDRPRDEAIHEARKHLKKGRALLRLVRPFLGPSFAWENDVCRAAAHLLATARDAAAMAEAVDRLREASRDPSAWDALRARVGERASSRAMPPGEEERILATIEERLRGVEMRLRSWGELPSEPPDLAPGAMRVIESGGRRYRVARRSRDPESVHAWRKRAKDLWYHARLLRGLGPLVDGLEASVDRLAEVLGQRHDLDVLESLFRAEPNLLEGSDPARLAGEIGVLRARLDEEAALLGEMIYEGGASALGTLLRDANS